VDAVDLTLSGPPLGDIGARHTDAAMPTGVPFELELEPGTLSRVIELPPEATFARVTASVVVDGWEPSDADVGRCSLVLMRDGVVVDTSVSEALRPATHRPLTLEVEDASDLLAGLSHGYSLGVRYWTGTNAPATLVTGFTVGAPTVRVIALAPDGTIPEPPEAPTGWPTGPELEGHLGGTLPAGLADRLCAVASAAVAPSVTVDPDTGPAPGAWLAALLIAADLYRASSSIEGGSYALDGSITFPTNVTSNLVRRYAALLAPTPAPTGMVG
jgi:hypothetical protein